MPNPGNGKPLSEQELHEAYALNPMRHMNTRRCLDCQKEWIQPAEFGRCINIRCQSDNVVTVQRRIDHSTKV